MSLSLRSKLTFAFAAVAAVPLTVLQQYATRLVRHDYTERTRTQLQESRQLLESEIERELREVAAVVDGTLRNLDVRGALLDLVHGQPGAQARLIDQVAGVAETTRLPLLTVYDEAGVVLASAQEPERFGVVDAQVVATACRHPGRPVLAAEQGIMVRGQALRWCERLDLAGERFWVVGGVLVDAALLERLPVPSALACLVRDRDATTMAPTTAGSAALAVANAAAADDAAQALGRAGWDVVALALPTIERAEPVTWLLATSRVEMEAALAQQNRIFGGLLAGGLLLAWLLGLAVAGRWSDPIEGLVSALERVAAGDLTVRVDMQRDDELGRLGAAFDAMTAELAESRGRLVQAERLAAWREIARRLAHEIKNPLSPIALSMETLQRSHAAGRSDFPELLRECTETVLEEVDRLRRIVQEFSDFARLPKPRLVTDSLNEVIRGVMALHGGLGPEYRFRLELAEGEGRFVFDLDQMNRLLVNLVQNAIEAMPTGGQITIRTEVLPDDGLMQLTVSDQGPGIAADSATQLFRPYHTTKVGGTGLGLAIVHRIASEHGGSVRLLNPGGAGAQFRVELPLTGPAPTLPSVDDEAGGQ